MTGRAFRPLALAVLLVGLVPNHGAAQDCSAPSFGRTDFATATALDTTAVGDFNWDGWPDLVGSSWAGDDVILVQLGDGAGGLSAATSFALGTVYTSDLAVADLNRDGRPDIVAASNPGTAPGPTRGRVTVLLATGPGSFGPPIDFDLSYWVSSLAVADFNSDGRLDVVTDAAVTSVPVDPLVLLGSGDGAFSAGAPIAVGSPTEFVLSGDFNRDGHADLVFTDTIVVDTLSIVLGNGDGTFGPPTTMSVTGNPSSGVVVDFDKDGVLDLAYWDLETVSVFLGTGAGTFIGPTEINLGPPGMGSIGAGDFDRDGNVDLAINTGGVGGLILATLLGDGNGGFGPPTTFGTAMFNTLGLSVADFDRDGRPDAVAAVDGGVAVFQNSSGIACSAASFGPAPRAFNVGTGPYWTVSADFDGDGRPDLATANYNSNDVTVLLGDGAGALALASTVPVGTAPIAAIAPDLNADGRPDLITANLSSSNLSIRLGNGSGGFSAAPDLSTGDIAFSLVAADFNSDGRTDLVASNPNLGTLSLFRGNGDGTFAAPVSIPLAGSAPVGLALGDMNADGRVDVVAADYNGAVWVLLGDGAGAFNALRTAAAATNPYFADLADFDADGRLDVVVSNSGLATVSLLLGNGSGNLGAPTQYPTLAGTDTRQVTAVDVNGDRRPDVVLAGMTSNAVSRLLGNGTGGLGAPATFMTGGSTASFAALDFTGDGIVDLAVLANNVAILVGDGLGGFAVPVRSAAGLPGGPRRPLLADFDRDGVLDLAAQHALGSENAVSVYLGDGAGGFGLSASVTVGVHPTVIAADLDGNGTLDLATANRDDANVSVVLGNGNGTFAAAVDYSVGPMPTMNPASIGAADLDRDGILDLVTSDSGWDALSILRGTGGGAFAAPVLVNLAIGAGPEALAAGDLDRNGTIDVVVANSGQPRASILLGNGVGGFGLEATVALGTVPGDLRLADLDGNGVLDLIVGSGSSNVAVLLGNGSGGFGAPALVDTGLRPISFELADLNGDGKADLIASGGPPTNTVSVLLGDGAGGFAARRSYQAGGLVFVAAGDVDRDGKTDVVTSSVLDNSFWTLLNTNCKTRGMLFTRNVSSCNLPATPFTSQPVLSVVDDGANVIQCAAGAVTASILPNTGTSGAALGGTPAVNPVSGVATYTDLSVNLVASGYQLLFAHAGARNAWSRRFNVGDPLITGPAGFCQTASAVYDVGAGYDSYAWTLDGGPVLSRLRNVTLSGLAPGLHDLAVTVSQAECADTQTLWVNVTAALGEVEIAMLGASGVCPTCTGGTASVTDTGGGTVTHQWGYRTVSGGAITALSGETGTDYELAGADFPGAGSYFLVVTTTPSCGSAMVSNEIPVGVYTTVAGDAVVVFTVTSKDQENTVEWLNPAIGASYVATRVQYNVGTPSCVAPTGPFEGTNLVRKVGSADAHDTTTHTGLTNGTSYCYAAFVEHTGVVFGDGRATTGRPFDTTGMVKWAYSTGATTMAPPGIGPGAVYSASNDLVLHGLVRGLGVSAGLWPPGWRPYLLNDASHHRMGIGTTSLVPGASRVAFIGAQDGYVYAVNADTGAQLWQSVPVGDVVATAPVAMFTGYGGVANQVYAGSLNSSLPNSFFALNTVNGAQVGLAFDNGGGGSAIGAIVGGGAVDYSLQRVYFTSRARAGGSNQTLWCLGITVGGLADDCGWPPQVLGDIDTAPTLRSGILYVGNNTGRVYAIDAASGVERWHYDTLDGAVKGFVFPDRNSNRVYFATEGTGMGQPGHVWGLADGGPGSVALAWPSVEISAPSIALFTPGGTHILVGSDDGGRLYQLDLTLAGPGTPPAPTSIVLGDGGAAVGSPSYDPYHGCIYVGSEAGVIYAVELPLP